MECPYCGHENIDGSDACEECLEDLTHLDEPTPTTPIERGIMEEPLRTVKSPAPPKISPEATLREAVAKLIDSDGAVLVVYVDALVGIFSERDLLMKVGDRYAELADRPVRDYMTPAPETLGGEDPIVYALNRMEVGRFRHIPIEENDVPVGMVSVRDILAHLATKYPEILTNA